MPPSNWTFSFDIETLGLEGQTRIGSATLKGPIHQKLFSAAITSGGTQSAFLGQSVVPDVFSMQKFLQLKSRGPQVHNLSIGADGITSKMQDYLQSHGYHTPGSDQMSINSAQQAYIESTAPNRSFIKKFITPTTTEVGKHGGKLYGSATKLGQEFVQHLERIQGEAAKAGVTPNLIGYNINRFDLPYMLEDLKKNDPSAAKRLQTVLGKMNVVDVAEKVREKISHAYLGAPAHLSGDEVVQAWRTRPEYAKGWNLDTAARMLGVKGRASGAAHGPLEDAELAERVLEALKKTEVTYDMHVGAMAASDDPALRSIAARLGADGTTPGGPVADSLPFEPKHPPMKKSAPPKLTSLAKRGMFQKFTKGKVAAFAGAVGAGYLLFGNDEDAESVKHTANTLVDSIMHPMAKRSEYISSSTLGLTRFTDIVGRVYDPMYGDALKDEDSIKKLKGERIMEAGNAMHEMIQRNMLAAGTAVETERYVEDASGKVFGYIDVIQKSGIPLEIKTVSEQALQSMRAPKPSAVSQANFYALATESPVAQILYVARENPTLRKTFTISADPGRYLKDVERIRAVQEQFKGNQSTRPYISNFRPLKSWLGGGVNYNMPYAHRSKVQGQRLRLADLPVASHWAQSPNTEHVNASRAGVI